MKFLRDRRYFRWNAVLALSSGFAGLLIVNANLLDINRLRIQIPMYFAITIAALLLIDRLGIGRLLHGRMNKFWQRCVLVALSIYTGYVIVLHYLHYFYQYQHHVSVSEWFILKTIIFAILGMFAIYTAWRFFFWAIVSLYSKLNLSKLEKKLILSYGALGFVLAIFMSIFVTNNFVLKLNIVDTLYAMDSSAFIYDETYDNNVNGLGTDVRHPFAQSISTPMGVISRVVGQVFHFVPYAQAHIYQLFMLIMIAVTGVLVTRLLNVGSAKLKVAVFIAYGCLYSTLIFAFAVEQYVQVVFFMVLTVYAFLNKWSDKWTIALLIMAAGYTVTSAILGLIFLLQKGALRIRLNKIAVAALAFLLVATASGKLLTLLFFNRQADQVTKFSSGVEFIEKIYQFINFAATTITAGFHTVIFDGSYYKYKTDDISMTQLNYIGLLVLVLVLLGFYVTRRTTLGRIAIGWVAYSFVICVVVGWGARFNEFALYSMYFGWAYFILLFEALKYIINYIGRSVHSRQNMMIAILGVVSIINVVQYYDVVTFAHRHYPPESIETTFKKYIPYEKESK